MWNDTPIRSAGRWPGNTWWTFCGRLSNPSGAVESLADQGWSGPARHLGRVVGAAERPDSGLAVGSLEQKGPLSNPVQRRLPNAEIHELIRPYGDGASHAQVAQAFGVHARTLAREFHRAGVSIRPQRGS